MRRNLTTKVRIILVAAVLCAALTVGWIIFQPGKAMPLNNAISTGLNPVKSVTTSLVENIETLYNYIFSYEKLQAENEHLREEIAQQNEDVRESQTYQAENERLRELMGLQEKHADYDLEIANVVSWGEQSYSSSITISKGSAAGLESGMCVITETGQMIGIIKECGSGWATVTTVLDTTSQIGAYIYGSGYSCLVQGNYDLLQQGNMRADYLSTSATIRNGDQVMTSGDGDVYPANLVLGTVSDVGKDQSNVAKYAVVTPTVDITTVEQVFVIKSFDIND